MARYFRQDIQGQGDPVTPPSGPLTGLQPLRRDRWEAPMRAQDSVPTVGRRIIMEAGAGQTKVGADASDWRFDSGEPSASPLNEIEFGFTRARLTSGCILRALVTYAPSGGVGGVPPDEAFGILRLRITWTAEDASTETHDVDIALAPSTNDNFDPLAGGGAAFGEVLTLERTIAPPVDFSNLVEANRWTVSPTVEVEAYLVGGARVLDLVLFEVPYQVCHEADDTSWASHVFATGEPDDASAAASNRPRTRRSETSPDGNPRGGTLQTIAVAREQRGRFGPVLLSWGNYQEATSAFNSGLVARSVAGSSTEIRCLFDSTQTAYDADREGLSVSCGGYARALRDNGAALLGTADAEAAVPVVFRVLGSTSSGTTDVRLQTSEHDWVSVTLTTTVGWREGWGWLRVGINPSDVRIAQVFVDGAGTVSVFAFELEVYQGD